MAFCVKMKCSVDLHGKMLQGLHVRQKDNQWIHFRLSFPLRAVDDAGMQQLPQVPLGVLAR